MLDAAARFDAQRFQAARLEFQHVRRVKRSMGANGVPPHRGTNQHNQTLGGSQRGASKTDKTAEASSAKTTLI